MLVTTCKAVLKVVRDIVRDLISEAVGKLISICLRWVPAVAACRKLTRVFTKAGGLFTGLERLLGHSKHLPAVATTSSTRSRRVRRRM
jgi:hypothetical protein